MSIRTSDHTIMTMIVRAGTGVGMALASTSMPSLSSLYVCRSMVGGPPAGTWAGTPGASPGWIPAGILPTLIVIYMLPVMPVPRELSEGCRADGRGMSGIRGHIFFIF